MTFKQKNPEIRAEWLWANRDRKKVGRWKFLQTCVLCLVFFDYNDLLNRVSNNYFVLKLTGLHTFVYSN